MAALVHMAVGLPLGFLGLPSVQEIVEAIANGFAQALAGALVPGFLKHASVATIQWLVALPDPASWTHVRQLEEEMGWLGLSLMPVTLAVSAIRYWSMGLTGAAHPMSAVARCAGSCGALVAYPWAVGQAVAGANTITHAILAFPQVADGLASLVTVLFGGALLSGGGSAFLAVLVIVAVVLAGALFAMQALLTLLLSVLVVAGPPLIALSPVPELAHLARGWARALGVVCLIPVCWTVLFAAAGALTLDATDVSGGAGGLPGHLSAAFAALATWVLAVRLPLLLLGELRGFLSGGLRGGGGASGGAGAASQLPGAERVRLAQARLRSVAVDGAPAIAGSVGAAAGALGAPQGGPLGAARRRFGRGGAGRDQAAGGPGQGSGGAQVEQRPAGGGARERLAQAGQILRDAPGRAREAVAEGSARESARARAGSRRTEHRRAPAAPGPRPGAGKGGNGGASGDRAARSAQGGRAPKPAADRTRKTPAGDGRGRPSAQPGSGQARAQPARQPARGKGMTPPPRQPQPAKPRQNARRQGKSGGNRKPAAEVPRSKRARRKPKR